MAIERYVLGPGTLSLGSGPLQVAAQVRACRVTASENVTETDAIPVLSGEEIAATSDQTYTFALTGTFIQDLAAAGVVDWSWTNKGTEQAFTFVPATAEARQVQGTLIPVPLDIGGDVIRPGSGDPPQADFTWRIVGDPDFEAAV